MENNRTYKILSATGIPVLNSALSQIDNFDVVGTCSIKSEMKLKIEETNPHILLVSDKISGEDNLIRLMIELKRQFPYVRIVYLAGNLNPKDTARVDMLGTLVLSGIYDILISQKVNIDIVADVIETPISESAVRYLTKNLLSSKAEIDNAIDGLQYEDFLDEDENASSAIKNLFVFSSVKPGTGKSFISVNTACAIAKYGHGKPRVALIEADLQTLSIGTLLAINEDNDRNMKVAMQAISGLFDKGNIVATEEKIRKANKTIRDCFVKCKDIPNLSVLVGSSLTPEEIDALKITPEYYTYLLESVKNDFDVIIVDTNSSIFHVTSFPILQRAKQCFYIINLDFNNIRNNVRYQNTLKSLGITNKISYILNEDIENSDEYARLGVDVEELYFTAEKVERDYLKLSAKVPILLKPVFLNRLYEGTPVVLDSDSVSYTNKVKYALMGIANGIWELDDSYKKLGKKLNPEKKSFWDFLKRGKKMGKKAEKKEDLPSKKAVPEDLTKERDKEMAEAAG